MGVGVVNHKKKQSCLVPNSNKERQNSLSGLIGIPIFRCEEHHLWRSASTASTRSQVSPRATSKTVL
jgi:hypothetical protein